MTMMLQEHLVLLHTARAVRVKLPRFSMEREREREIHMHTHIYIYKHICLYRCYTSTCKDYTKLYIYIYIHRVI